jgi:hypothetical protein
MTTRSGKSYRAGIESKEITKSKKIDYTEVEETDGEDRNDFNISNPAKHFEFLTKDIPDKYLKSPNVMYMHRIYARSTNEYYLKSGFTDDYSKRIRSLNCEYDACGRIIPILFVTVESIKKERAIHKTLQKYRSKVTIKMKGKKELYPANPKMYDLLEKAMLKASVDGEIYESERYVLGDDCSETFDDVELNRDDTEDDYWFSKIPEE